MVAQIQTNFSVLLNLFVHGGFAGTVLLIFVAIFLISNTIRMTIMSRQRDIEICVW